MNEEGLVVKYVIQKFSKLECNSCIRTNSTPHHMFHTNAYLMLAPCECVGNKILKDVVTELLEQVALFIPPNGLFRISACLGGTEQKHVVEASPLTMESALEEFTDIFCKKAEACWMETWRKNWISFYIENPWTSGRCIEPSFVTSMLHFRKNQRAALGVRNNLNALLTDEDHILNKIMLLRLSCFNREKIN